MGKNLIQQARGKGGPTYRSPSFRYLGRAAHPALKDSNGSIVDIVHCQGHTAPLAQVEYEDKTEGYIIAPEGIAVGDNISSSSNAELRPGNILPLLQIPEGTLVHNIEQIAGDGGKFVRASGVFAKVIAKKENLVTVILPSKKTKDFDGSCRASIGVVAGGGRPEKPFLKAGTKWMMMRTTNKLYPIVSGAKQNAVDHPFGNKRSSRKSKSRPVSRNAPPGRKVGMIAARRSGRKKR
jgi:large subunit ribosomal protein L2